MILGFLLSLKPSELPFQEELASSCVFQQPLCLTNLIISSSYYQLFHLSTTKPATFPWVFRAWFAYHLSPHWWEAPRGKINHPSCSQLYACQASRKCFSATWENACLEHWGLFQNGGPGASHVYSLAALSQHTGATHWLPYLNYFLSQVDLFFLSQQDSSQIVESEWATTGFWEPGSFYVFRNKEGNCTKWTVWVSSKCCQSEKLLLGLEGRKICLHLSSRLTVLDSLHTQPWWGGRHNIYRA